MKPTKPDLIAIIQELRDDMNRRLVNATLKTTNIRCSCIPAPAPRSLPRRHHPNRHRSRQGSSRAAPHGDQAMMRRKGSGTIEQMRSGRWRFRMADVEGKRKWSPTYETRADAAAVLDAALYKLADAPPVARARAETLGEYAEQMLARRTVRSAEYERRLWAGHVADSPLVRLPLAEVKRCHVRQFIEDLGKKKKLVAKSCGKRGERVESDEVLSHQTIKLTFALVRLVLNKAVNDEMIPVYPCAGYKLPRAVAALGGDLDPAWTFLSQDEIERLLRNCSAGGISPFPSRVGGK